jgi:hypothetical protein
VKEIVERQGGYVGLILGERRAEGHCAFEITIDLPSSVVWS